MLKKSKQPTGFAIFFLTEMWERYGFYVLQSLLLLYAISQLHLSDTAVYTLLGSFTALAYINSIFGGLIADRLIGYDVAIIGGALLMCCGYTLLSYADNSEVFLGGLAIIATGTGLLKPNISSMLATIYKNQPHQKNLGYTLFYVGIYCGALCGSFVGGFIQRYWGWAAVFSSATVGLVIALCIFMYGQKRFGLFDLRLNGIVKTTKALLTITLLLLVSYSGLRYSVVANCIFAGIIAWCIVYLAKTILAHHGQDRQKLIVFSVILLMSVVYWTIYFQQFFSVGLYAARISSLSIPQSSLTAFESLGVIIFGPLVNSLWIFLAKQGKVCSVATKVAISLLCNSIGFLVLSLSIEYAIWQHIMEQQIFIIVCYFTIALGEVFIAPAGLAMVSTLVPPRLNGAMMGMFLLSIGLGGKLAGSLSQLAAVNAITTASVTSLEVVYRNSFGIYGIISFAMFIACFLLIRPLNRLMSFSA